MKIKPTNRRCLCWSISRSARYRFGILRIAPQLHSLKAGAGHSLANFRLAHHGRYILHACLLARIRDLRLQDTFDLEQRLFQATGVIIIREPLDDQFSFSRGNAITGACRTRAIISGKPSLAASKSTVARSEERLTTALFTPSNFFRLRSTVATQLAQVMPVMGKVNCLVSVMRGSKIQKIKGAKAPKN